MKTINTRTKDYYLVHITNDGGISAAEFATTLTDIDANAAGEIVLDCLRKKSRAYLS